MILDNLRKAGSRTPSRATLVFGRLDPTPAPSSGHRRLPRPRHALPRRRIDRPRHGTVTPEQVKEAAKEAVQGARFKVLIVCGCLRPARLRGGQALRGLRSSARMIDLLIGETS
ncbi:MAG: hypothetical protein WKF75_06880 [Singulisphaera sp.]